MPKYKSGYKYRGRSRQTSKRGRRALFGRPQRALPSRQQFADQIGGYALNKGDTVKTSLKVFTDPQTVSLGNVAAHATNFDLARQLTVALSHYGAANDDYRLITAAWQRYRIVGATIFVGQPYYQSGSSGLGRIYYDSFVYLAVLKKKVNGAINTATMRGIENCEFKMMTASNDVLRKRMKYPAVPVETASLTTSSLNAFKNMWLQTSDDGATVPHYSFLIGANSTSAYLSSAQAISIDYQVQLELQLDRPNYQDNNISRINDAKPTQADLDKIEALYQKHFCDNDSESEVEDIPPYDEPLCKRLLGPVPLNPRARAQSAASA